MKETALITGSCGLVGSESVRFLSKKGFKVIGIDNNMRKVFFGEDASVEWNKKRLLEEIESYKHFNLDIRNAADVKRLFQENRFDLIIHTAAQPSHDWAAKDPYTDFSVNAQGTLVLLESFRRFCPDAVFIFTSTNKVYGDRPNSLPLLELDTRYELPSEHRFYQGIDETMEIDQSLHSLFGVSKASADLLVQEYGRYFGLKTVCFRGGCLTGPAHSGTRLHGFLSYLVRCCITGRKYTIYGYKGKQVRDNIHSYDLVNAFYQFYQNPRIGEVYNMAGSRYSNVSMMEAIEIVQSITGKKLSCEYTDKSRIGDHKWWISNVAKFKTHYPQWGFTYDVPKIVEEIYSEQLKHKNQFV